MLYAEATSPQQLPGSERPFTTRPRWKNAAPLSCGPAFDCQNHTRAAFFDEKRGIQALGTTAPDLPPKRVLGPSFGRTRAPGGHACLTRDHEYAPHGTLSLLLAGIDLATGKVHARVEKRHRSVEFIAFLKQLDQAVY